MGGKFTILFSLSCQNLQKISPVNKKAGAVFETVNFSIQQQLYWNDHIRLYPMRVEGRRLRCIQFSVSSTSTHRLPLRPSRASAGPPSQTCFIILLVSYNWMCVYNVNLSYVIRTHMHARTHREQNWFCCSLSEHF